MNVTVRFFAAARELAGCSELVKSLPAGARVGDVRDALVAEHPGLGELALAFAVNQSYAGPETALHDGDELVFIPPVGGG